MTLELHRLQDLSIYYWLQDLMPAFVTVVDGFPDSDLVIPTVSIEAMDTWGDPFELGGLDQKRRFWRIDVFAKNKSQRDDFADYIFDQLEGNIPVYDYNEGFPPPTPTQIGALKCLNRSNKTVYVFKELVRDLYWRRSITFQTEYETI